MSASFLPEGQHCVCITKLETKSNKNGGEYVQVTLVCLTGPLKGARHFDSIITVSGDTIAVTRGLTQQSTYAIAACGSPEMGMPRPALEDALFKPIIITLIPQKTDPKRMWLKKVEPLPKDWTDVQRWAAEDEATKLAELLPTPPDASIAPLPLSRELPAANPFPMDALGPVLGAAALAIKYRVQCPAALAGQSVLAAASLAVQSHVNVFLPTEGKAKPTSMFLVTVAASGERKSTADSLALEPITKFQSKRFKEYEVLKKQHVSDLSKWTLKRDEITKASRVTVEDKQRMLDELGPPPEAPLKPQVKCSEPTFEGLVKLLQTGSPSLGLFNNEGGHFLGGHGMKAENRLQMGSGLAMLWDGQPLERVRASGKDGDGEATLMEGRRLALHLMLQPEVSANLLSDEKLKDQGFLARLLTSFPDSTAGTRFQHPQDAQHASHDAWCDQALAAYSVNITALLEWPAPLVERNELAPRPLRLSPEAVQLCRDYADHNERKLGPSGDYAPIRSFANRMTEHACRISAVITVFERGPNVLEIPADAFECAIKLTDFYAGEALRLWDAAVKSPDLKAAEALLAWFKSRPADGASLQDVYQRGPATVRNKADAIRILSILEDHRLIIKHGDRNAKARWVLPLVPLLASLALAG